MLIFTYHLYPLTDFVTDIDVRERVGQALVIMTLGNIALNLGVIFVATVVATLWKLKLKWKKWKIAREIRKRRD